MISTDSSADGLSWNQWLTVGLLLQKTVGEESCYAERDLFENVFRAWAAYFDGQQLLSAAAAEKWMLSFSSQLTASTFCRNIFPLLDRDGDGHVQVHEFVLGMIVLLKETCCSPPPCPALIKSQRQMAFQYYDQDKDGLLGGAEWNQFVNDCLIQSEKPPESALASNFGICVRGVSHCLAARQENEMIVPRRAPPRAGRLWAEDFWMERRATITYDAFYEALERGLFSEPRKFMELDLLRPPLHQWTASNIRAQGDQTEEFSRLMTESLKFTVSMFNGVKETLLPIIAQQAKAGYDQAVSLLQSSGDLAEAKGHNTDSKDLTTNAPIASGAALVPLAAACVGQDDNSAVSDGTDRSPTEATGACLQEAESQSSAFTDALDVSISVPSTETLFAATVGETQARATDLDGSRTARSMLHEKLLKPVADEPAGQNSIDDSSESIEQCKEYRDKLVAMYINQMAWLMSREKVAADISYSTLDLLLLCESLGQRMLYIERVCHEVQLPDQGHLTFVGDISGDVERIRKIIREICVEENGYWRLPESSKVVFTGNILSANTSVRAETTHASNNLDVLLTVWAFKAVYPENVFLLRGRNEACTHTPLLMECETRWGAEEGKKLWNVLLDTWEMAPLAYDIGGEGCVYGASLTGAVEAIWDGLNELERPLKIDIASNEISDYGSQCIPSELWTSSDRAAMHSLEDKLKAVRESYSTKNSPNFIAAVIRLRTRFGFHWIIQDQFVTSTEKVEHSRWFDIARFWRSEKGASWVLDSYRGDLRERIWPSNYAEKCSAPVHCDLAMMTTSDGVSPSPSTTEIIEFERCLQPS